MAPGVGSAHLLDQPHWRRDSRKPAGAQRASRGFSRAAQGPQMEIWCPPLVLNCHEAHAPWKSPPPLLWKPGSRVFCRLDVDRVPWSETPMCSTSSSQPLSGLGLAGAPPLSHLLQPQQLLNAAPSPQQSGGRCSAASHLPLFGGGPEALRLRVP